MILLISSGNPLARLVLYSESRPFSLTELIALILPDSRRPIYSGEYIGGVCVLFAGKLSVRGKATESVATEL